MPAGEFVAMAPGYDNTIRQLPIVPEDILRRHRVQEPASACAECPKHLARGSKPVCAYEAGAWLPRLAGLRTDDLRGTKSLRRGCVAGPTVPGAILRAIPFVLKE